MSDYKTLPMKIELEDRAKRGRIGMLLLGTDFTTEQEAPNLLPEGVQAFTNRVANINPLTLENLKIMEADITRAAAGILPGRGVDVMMFGCTSGTAAIGDARIESLIHHACPGIPVTNPLRAGVAACAALNIKKLALLTPYIQEVSEQLAKEFQTRGLEISSLHGLEMEDDIDIAMLPFDQMETAARAVIEADPQAEGLFLSCTALRAASIAQHLEDILGLPVITSNQAMLWHALRLIGVEDAVPGFGRLLQVGLAD